MIDIILNFCQIFWNCFMLVFNMEIPFYEEKTIKFGVLAIAFITLITIICFVLKSIGIIRKGDD